MKTILIVDDCSAYRNLLQETLELHGYKVLTVPDCAGVYQLLHIQPTRVRLIITEYYLRDGSAFELIRKLRETTEFWVPVLVLTSVTNRHLILGVRELINTSWVSKPFRVDQLLKEIDSALRSPAE